MSVLRLAVRVPLFLLFLTLTAVIAACFVLPPARRALAPARVAHWCFRGCRRCLGVRVHGYGEITATPGLYISNHISWLDIPLLGCLTPLRFLSKAEVRRWPLIGWLARQAGTLFIQRGAGQVSQRRQDLVSVLGQGESVLVFPEGTTSSGLTVLPLHARLLGAATAAEVAITPVSIGYTRNGQPCHLAPFTGDDSFVSHLLRLLAAPPVDVWILCHPPVTPCPEESTAALGARLRETLVAGLRQIHRDASARGCPAATSASVASRTSLISSSK